MASLSKSKTNTISQIKNSDEDHISIASSGGKSYLREYHDPAIVISVKAESIQMDLYATCID